MAIKSGLSAIPADALDIRVGDREVSLEGVGGVTTNPEADTTNTTRWLRGLRQTSQRAGPGTVSFDVPNMNTNFAGYRALYSARQSGNPTNFEIVSKGAVIAAAPSTANARTVAIAAASSDKNFEPNGYFYLATFAGSSMPDFRQDQFQSGQCIRVGDAATAAAGDRLILIQQVQDNVANMVAVHPDARQGEWVNGGAATAEAYTAATGKFISIVEAAYRWNFSATVTSMPSLASWTAEGGLATATVEISPVTEISLPVLDATPALYV